MLATDHGCAERKRSLAALAAGRMAAAKPAASKEVLSKPPPAKSLNARRHKRG
jgi:hypothetical protein